MKLTQKEFELKYTPTEISNFYPSVDTMPFSEMISNRLYGQRLCFYGEPGIGKTTLARILAANILQLNEEDTRKLVVKDPEYYCPNFIEADFAVDPSADHVQRICESINSALTNGGLFEKEKYVFLLDEFTQLLPQTQKRLIKIIGDNTESNIHIIVTTNDLSKMDSSFSDRTTKFGFTVPTKEVFEQYIKSVLTKEKVPVNTIDIEKIYNSSDRSFRNILSTLWYFITYGSLPQSENESDTKPISDYLGAIDDIAKELASLMYASKENNTPIDYNKIPKQQYMSLLKSIEQIKLVKKVPKTTHIAFVYYTKYILTNANADYKRLIKLSHFINEIDCLRDSYDVALEYQLLNIANKCIEARAKYYLESTDGNFITQKGLPIGN